MLNVGIIGATGYTGEELISILLGHPEVRITYLAAKIDKPTPIDKIFPRFKNRIKLICEPFNINSAIFLCDVLFLALPHTVSMTVVPKLLKAHKRVIDLSADYRLMNTGVYQEFYGKKHNDKQNLKAAFYGLPEIYRNKIKQSRLVANPGCYPTAAILGLAPLVSCEKISSQDSIIIDAKTGVTGAGRRALLEYFFSEINEDAYPYKINMHQHIPEINQELTKLANKSIKVTFVPHLIPVDRGILETIYVQQNSKSQPKADSPSAKDIKYQKLLALYKKFYKKEPFVRIKEDDEGVRLKNVVKTNFCDIAITPFSASRLIVITVAIDNLSKGASGQAVQNMNIMYGFPEQSALV